MQLPTVSCGTFQNNVALVSSPDLTLPQGETV